MSLKIRMETPRLKAEADAVERVRAQLRKAQNPIVIPSVDLAVAWGECNWCSTKMWQNAWTGFPYLCPEHAAQQERQRLVAQANAEAALERTQQQIAKARTKGGKKARKLAAKLARENGGEEVPF